jgi:hydroxymethylpyrimidine/phosphomethylpyrimidine kinase
MRLAGRVLAIAGSDSGGGAGIQADVRACMAMGAFCSTAITALTAQDTRGVRAVHAVPVDFLRLQIEMALADPGADAVKTGMLGSAEAVTCVAAAIARFAGPVVIDPVMTAKGGADLAGGAATVERLRALLLPRATLLTPNVPEAEVLTGRRIAGAADMRGAAEALLELGPHAVLLKGGHLEGDALLDLLVWPGGEQRFVATRVATPHTHGTGCTLASAIAAGLAQSLSLLDAVTRAVAYVRAAIVQAPGLGQGHGPLNHAALLQ